jgi:small subunit ribosomal protein S17e
MGRIKQQYLKRVAIELMEKHGSEFGTDFQENKRKVAEYSTVQSKSIRNRIAGCLVRAAKKQAAAD